MSNAKYAATPDQHCHPRQVVFLIWLVAPVVGPSHASHHVANASRHSIYRTMPMLAVQVLYLHEGVQTYHKVHRVSERLS